MSMVESDGKPERDISAVLAEAIQLCERLEAALKASALGMLPALATQPTASAGPPPDGMRIRDRAELVLRGPDGAIKEVRHV